MDSRQFDKTWSNHQVFPTQLGIALILLPLLNVRALKQLVLLLLALFLQLVYLSFLVAPFLFEE